MTYTPEQLDSADCYSRMRRGLIRILGRPDPNLVNVARNMDLDLDEFTQFIKRHLGSPANINRGQLDRLAVKFAKGDADPAVETGAPEVASPRERVEESPPTPTRRVTPAEPPGRAEAKQVSFRGLKNGSPEYIAAKRVYDKQWRQNRRGHVVAAALAGEPVIADDQRTTKTKSTRSEAWYVGKFGKVRGAKLFAAKQASRNDGPTARAQSAKSGIPRASGGGGGGDAMALPPEGAEPVTITPPAPIICPVHLVVTVTLRVVNG